MFKSEIIAYLERERTKYPDSEALREVYTSSLLATMFDGGAIESFCPRLGVKNPRPDGYFRRELQVPIKTPTPIFFMFFKTHEYDTKIAYLVEQKESVIELRLFIKRQGEVVYVPSMAKISSNGAAFAPTVTYCGVSEGVLGLWPGVRALNYLLLTVHDGQWETEITLSDNKATDTMKLVNGAAMYRETVEGEKGGECSTNSSTH